jgi:GT2 family glycosyltransferase
MPTLEFVQFIDGDCELASGWLHKAASFLATNPRLAIVSGRLRERFPDRSVYNMLCDIEWDAPAGEARYCGGVAMTRASAFEAAGGYSADLIAGEEPELCVRLRASGWGIWRLEDEMALHDAAMLRFEQWWRRSIRGGHAFAQAASMHGRPPELMGVRESRSAWFWAACVPLLILLCCSALGPRSLWFALLYPAQVVRLALRGKRSPRENWLHAFFLVLGKFPEVIGQVVFRWRHLQGGSHGLIEHK